MLAATRSKLCSSVSAWSGVFASIAMSSPYSASVIVVAGYLLLLFFVSSKPFSLILSIDVLDTKSLNYRDSDKNEEHLKGLQTHNVFTNDMEVLKIFLYEIDYIFESRIIFPGE